MKKIKILSLLMVSVISLTGCIAKTTNDVSFENTQTTPTTQTESVQSSQTVKNISDLDNSLKLGCQYGGSSEEWFSNNIKNSSIVTFPTNDSLVQNLINGNLDAILVDEYYANYISLKDNLSISNLKFTTEEYAFAFKKGNDDIRLAVNETLNEFKNNGTISTIKNVYMPANGEVTPTPRKDHSETASVTLKVGTCADFYPFEYSSNGEIFGFDITLIEMIAEKNNWNVEFVNMDFNKLIDQLNLGEIDMIVSGMTINDKRNDLVDFSLPYFETEQVVVTR